MDEVSLIDLVFTNETKAKIDAFIFQKLFSKALKVLHTRIADALEGSKGSVDLVLVNDESIHEINKHYRNKDRATDVISFAYLEATEGKRGQSELLVGDIFISVDTANRQALEKGHTLEQELRILFTHGFLHLLGFDHQNDEQEEEMEAFAKEILEG